MPNLIGKLMINWIQLTEFEIQIRDLVGKLVVLKGNLLDDAIQVVHLLMQLGILGHGPLQSFF